MSDWTADIRNAFIGTDGMARFTRLLFDEEIKTLYFEHVDGSVTEVWLEADDERREDFGVWPNNNLNNPHATVLWEQDSTPETIDEGI